ncbi:MAG: 50S ribosomal protein L11 methyltransferase [Dysgonamonadaceae bacterium]|jgi:ribosomal protein L11 methyltransferase|nr:50S ribosomal protein L11 methyltransferase [Dysgonamonadaceae bacterium]
MNYYELKLAITPDTEVNRDVISAVFAEIGFESFVASEKGLDAYIPETFYDKDAIAEALENLPLPDIKVDYQAEWIPDKNWNEEWEKNFFRPIIIDKQVVIHSSFHKDIPSLPYDIVIDPKMAFGTGHHYTTALMVSYLLELDLQDKSFLDMGCGTAVLAILAAKRGARPVTAIDIDHWAYENAMENIQLNHTPEIRVNKGDAALLGKDSYAVIFANINRNILLNDIPVYAGCMQPDANLFLSGFYREDMAIIQEKCKSEQLAFVGFKEENNWVAMQFRK